MAKLQHFRLIDSMDCDALAAFGSNFDPDKKKIVGHFNKIVFKADSKEITLEPDIPARDPENPSGDLIKVVAVLDWVDWAGEATDPFGFIGRISPANQEKMNEALSSGGGKNMDLEWKVYKYSDAKKTHFVTFSSGDSAIQMTLDTSAIGIGVKPEVEDEPADPRNFRFTLFTKAIGNQKLLYASGVGANEQKQAGNALEA